MKKAYFSTVQPGDMLKAQVKSPLTRVQVSQFAAASDDFNPMCLDEAQAKSKGYSGACAHPQIGFAYIEEALRGFAENMRIFELNTTFQKLLWPGDLLTAKGIVSKRYEKDNGCWVEFDLWVENQNQDVVLKGKATCLLFKSPGREKKSKSKLPELTISSIS